MMCEQFILNAVTEANGKPVDVDELIMLWHSQHRGSPQHLKAEIERLTDGGKIVRKAYFIMLPEQDVPPDIVAEGEHDAET